VVRFVEVAAMHAVKVLAIVAVVGVLAAAGVFTFVPSTRPSFVKAWFQKASGFTPAKSPEDALDKFKKALEKRDYEAAALYVSGDYKEFIDKGAKDAKTLATAIDNLRSVMKDRNITSDKVDYALFLLTPFPETFKIGKVTKEGDNKASAVIDWSDDVARFKVHLGEWKIKPELIHSLMPSTNLGLVRVDLKNDGGSWKIVIPVEITSAYGRHMRSSTEALRKHAGNYKEALRGVTDDLKRDATTKEDLESALKVAIEKSN
jgi:hypothetical protein